MSGHDEVNSIDREFVNIMTTALSSIVSSMINAMSDENSADRAHLNVVLKSSL
jgi:hypothetical protein